MDTLNLVSNELDSRLSEEIRASNVAAFEKLFRKYHSSLCDFAYRIVKAHDTPEDIVQEMFTHIWIDRENWFPQSYDGACTFLSGAFGGFVLAEKKEQNLGH